MGQLGTMAHVLSVYGEHTILSNADSSKHAGAEYLLGPPTSQHQWKRGTRAKPTKEAKKATDALKLRKRAGMYGQARATHDRTPTMKRYVLPVLSWHQYP